MEQDLTMNTGEYFETLSPEEQARIFTKAGAQAIRDGADINQVVNARRGMSTIQSPGSTKWMVTSEGTAGRRGRAARAMDSAGLSVRSKDNVMRFRLTRQRLMPETIYQISTGPEDTQRLLRMYGYI